MSRSSSRNSQYKEKYQVFTKSRRLWYGKMNRWTLRKFVQHIFSCFIFYIDLENFDDDSICITTQFLFKQKKNNNKIETDTTKKEVMSCVFSGYVCACVCVHVMEKREWIMFREKLYPIHMIVIIMIMYVHNLKVKTFP